jgi:Predicted membrane protein
MQIKDYLKQATPHIIAIAIFLALSIAYFYPVLEGKRLKTNDSTVSKINSKEIWDYRAKYNKEPLWTNSIFSGMPAYMISAKYPGNLFAHIDILLKKLGDPASVIFLSMAGFYIMLLLFGVNPWLSIAGSVGYGLSSFLFQVIAAGHNTQAIALAYMAPMIGSVWYAYRRDAVKGALLTAFFLTLEIIASHPQMTYYALMCLLVFGGTEFVFAVREKTILKFLKTSAILVIPFIIAIGINFAFLYTTYEYGKSSTRSKSELTAPAANKSTGLDRDYITYWSYGVDETMNLLIPDFKGGSSEPFDRNSETFKVLKQNGQGQVIDQTTKYWGTQPGTSGPHYVGAIIFFLFVLGLIIVKGPEKWWLLVATLLSLMLAWGKNFMPLTNLFIDYFPGYNKFRSVTFILVISQFCIPLLGVLALRDIFKSETPKKDFLKAMATAAGITGGVLLLIMLIPGFAGSFLNPYENQAPDWVRSALIADRKHLLENDAFRSLVFILLSAGVILAFMYEKLRKEYTIAIIGVLILFDLWSVDKRYLNSDNFQNQIVHNKSFTPTAADSYILKDPSYFRVWNHIVSTFNDNSPTSYFHKSIGGYNGAKIKRYQELIDSAITKDMKVFDAVGRTARTIDEVLPVFDKTYTLNMLNTKYIIYNPDAPPIVNPKALGNAWFVAKPEIAENADMELSMTSITDPSKTAIIDKRFLDQVTKSSYPIEEGDNIRLLTYQPNELVYKSSAKSEKLALFSDIYYSAGWKCYVDGKESKYFRANYVLRAMIVPGGDHEIKFTFRPSSYYTANTVSLASSIILILLIAGYVVIRIRKK